MIFNNRNIVIDNNFNGRYWKTEGNLIINSLFKTYNSIKDINNYNIKQYYAHLIDNNSDISTVRPDSRDSGKIVRR